MSDYSLAHPGRIPWPPESPHSADPLRSISTFDTPNKLRALRQQKKLSLEQLAELTDSSKSYIWELENRDDPNPSADKVSKLAAVLDVTTEFLLSHTTASPDAEVVDEAFFRKYKAMPESTKKQIRKILDAWDDDE